MRNTLAMLLFLTFFLFSCSGETEIDSVFKDGVYTAEFDHFDSHGWKAVLELKIDEGRIVSALYDYKNRAGDLKRNNEWYADTMKAKSGVTPAEAAVELERQLIESQSTSIDGVSGATHSSHTFIDMVKVLLVHAEKGDLQKKVFQSYDKVKQAKDDPDSRGYTAELFLGFNNEKLETVYYNEVNSSGVGKLGNDNYNSMMAEKSGIRWDDALSEIIADYKENGAPVDAVSGATGLYQRFNALVDKAE